MSNRSLLPVDITDTLAQLEAELKAGDITSRGYLKRRGQILEKYPHFRQANGSVTFRAGGGEGAGPVGGATRRLLSIHVPDEVREEPIKSLRDDIIQAVTSWEHTYGPWVSGWSQTSVCHDVMITSFRIRTTRDGRDGDCRGNVCVSSQRRLRGSRELRGSGEGRGTCTPLPLVKVDI